MVDKIYPEGDVITVLDAAVHYRARKVPVIVLGGRNFGAGSSRDWAAKGPALLGVRAVIARSFERIHRSNLIGVGVVPLLFAPEQSVEALGLVGSEEFSFEGSRRRHRRPPADWRHRAPSEWRGTPL